MENKTTICVEGNIGCGKSTLLKRLSEKYICFPEQVDKWTLLPLFYKDEKKFSMPLSIQILATQFEQITEIENIKKGLVFMERSPWSSKKVFLEVSRKRGNWNETYTNAYEKFFDSLTFFEFDCIIMLELSPEVCFDRIKMRNRECEKNISLSYLKELHEQYEFELNKIKNKKIIRVDVFGKSVEDIIQEILTILK